MFRICWQKQQQRASELRDAILIASKACDEMIRSGATAGEINVAVDPNPPGFSIWLYVQKVGDLFYFQLCLPEDVSPAHEDCYYVLHGQPISPNIDDLVVMTWDDKPEGHFSVSCTEGAYFSNRLLVSADTLLRAMRNFPSDLERLPDWIAEHDLVNVGII